jgi:hypothetical protein
MRSKGGWAAKNPVKKAINPESSGQRIAGEQFASTLGLP